MWQEKKICLVCGMDKIQCHILGPKKNKAQDERREWKITINTQHLRLRYGICAADIWC